MSPGLILSRLCLSRRFQFFGMSETSSRSTLRTFSTVSSSITRRRPASAAFSVGTITVMSLCRILIVRYSRRSPKTSLISLACTCPAPWCGYTTLSPSSNSMYSPRTVTSMSSSRSTSGSSSTPASASTSASASASTSASTSASASDREFDVLAQTGDLDVLVEVDVRVEFDAGIGVYVSIGIGVYVSIDVGIGIGIELNLEPGSGVQFVDDNDDVGQRL